MNQEINIAIIPARGGSKAIPNKNIGELIGKPLIQYVIESAKNSKFINKVFVLTDDLNIGKIAIKNGVEVIYEKEKNKDQFDLTKESYIQYAVKEIEEKGYEIGDIIFIQCTSPFTTSKDLDKSYEKYKEESCDSLLSVTKSAGGFKCGGFLWDDKGNSLNYDYKKRKRRQELPITYLENGAFYIFSREGLKKYENRLHGKIGYYIMPSIRSFEIDEPEDWEILEILFKYLRERK